jgi:hypothetical protein
MKQIKIFSLLFFLLISFALSAQVETYDDSKTGKSKEIEHSFRGLIPSQTITVEEVDGMYIFEGDIIVGPKGIENLSEDAGNPSGSCGSRWPNATIPYVIASGHPKKRDIETAIATLNKETVLKVIPRTNQADYVEFVTGGGCSSYIGKIGGRQTINIGSCSIGSIMHEVFHAAGMLHEQSRSDRDDYLVIKTENIQSDRLNNFRKVEGTISSCYYDFGSIMQYPNTAFSKGRSITIEPKGNLANELKLAQITLGQRNALSIGDIEGIANLYPQATGEASYTNSDVCNPAWGRPTIVSMNGSHIDVYLRKNSDGSVSHRWWQNNAWHGSFANEGGKIPQGAEVAVISTGNNKIDLFARGMDNALWHRKWNNGWSNWESLGGQITNDPQVVSWGKDRMDIFARGTDGSLIHYWYGDDGRYGGKESLGGVMPASSGVSAVSWGERRLDVFVRGMDNQLWRKSYNGNNWEKWASHGGVLTSNPAAVCMGPNRIDVFVRNTNGEMATISFANSKWSNWNRINTGKIPPGANLCVVSREPNRLNVFYRGMQNDLWNVWFSGREWGSESLGGKISSDPSAVFRSGGKLDVVARGLNDKIFFARFDKTWTTGTL